MDRDQSTGANGHGVSPQQAVGRAASEISSAVGEVKTAAGEAGHRLKEAGASAAASIAGTVRDEATYRKDRVSGSIQRIASEMERVATNVGEEDQWASALLTKGASSLTKASGYLSSARIDDLLRDGESFARRNPAVFLGASVALGFLLARVGKAAAMRASELSNGARDDFADEGLSSEYGSIL